uniref:single-stranded DNA cytosine deaminase n=1 Tax=Cavia porcellus TaxID=10141 RepID=H0VE76_CAVPO|nr:DNA dC->dU-editing enzyme APOBEC3-like [Cavia porcellus]
MERSDWSGRDSLEEVCPRGCRWTAHYREPMDCLYQSTFYFHFENLPNADGRHKTFLCFEVKNRNEVLHKGFFLNQPSPFRLHAELSFLSWFHDTELSFDENYKVTWYMSWSPCPECAKEIVTFLDNHHNVTLTIYVARLYYHWNPTYKEGLRALVQGGTRLYTMAFPEFEDCWSLFVCNETFRPWENFHKCCSLQDKTLQKILRRGKMLKEETFRVQFNNAHKAQKPYRRRVTYLCYQLQEANGNLTKGCFRNKKGLHAERRFIKRISSMKLDQAQSYQITCYLTWSPCPLCAQELAQFKHSHPRVQLKVFVSRLYFHWKRTYQEALHRLCTSQVPVTVMGLPEFADCWDNFVDHQSEPFKSWDKLEQYSNSIERRLLQILKSWGVDDLTANLRTLQLGPTSPPVAGRDP